MQNLEANARFVGERLVTCKRKYLSIEGRLLLIDYILTSLLLYFDEAGRAWCEAYGADSK